MTAIEWLIEQWPIIKSQLPPWLIKQALEMEKDQRKDSFMEGHNVCRCVTDNTDEAEEIFNETYKFNNL